MVEKIALKLFDVTEQVTTLDAVPDINMLTYLPEILDGLFQILGDQNQEIRQTYVQ